MLEVFILTSRYPYGVGEEFFADELKFWAKNKDAVVTLFPLNTDGDKRKIPDSVLTNECLALDSKIHKYTDAVAVLFSVIFLKEIFRLFSARKLSYRRIRSLIICVATMSRVEKRLARHIKENKSPDVIYSYWNEAPAYGACLLKRNGLVRHVVSRAHGADLYEERRPGCYSPLKKDFIDDFDRVYVLAKDAGTYLLKNYGAKSEIIEVAPLGVKVPANLHKYSKEEKSLCVLSLSYCVPIKRIDRIIEALEIVARRLPDWKIEWTHVGSGPLFNQLEDHAKNAFHQFSNINKYFTGHLSNNEVRKLLSSKTFDVIVNASESEGIPVSLMEAMSYGIPAIAPDVGEVSSLVSAEVGVLLSSTPTPENIADALIKVKACESLSELRETAHKKIDFYFNEKKNYAQFVSSVISLAKS